MRDPIENAFTVGMPRGWHNRTHSVRVSDVHSMLLSTVSPDGSVLIFSGDPSLPQYWSPQAATPLLYDMARFNRHMRIEPFVPAPRYIPEYIRRKFGTLPDFALLAVEPNPAAAERLRASAAAAGINLWPTAADVSFRYTDAGRTMNALVMGSTTDGGSFWTVTVSGIATEGDPKDYVPMLDAIGRSHQMNPAWQREQATRHQARMAQIDGFGRQMTSQHEQNMAAIQQSARVHQERMRAIEAQADASMQSYNQRMAAGDAQHRSFLNYVNEERTVVDSSGKTYQVAASYQRYFVNKHDGTYVGAHAGMGPELLRALGLNPGDYEEAKIVR
ncbi:MAG: hypothetical protein ACAI25_16525 [Planctomycetota bacterium]